MMHDARQAEIERELGIRHAVPGVWWYDAPLPRRLHRCRPWTTSPNVERCACGAMRYAGYRPWIQRNERRR